MTTPSNAELYNWLADSSRAHGDTRADERAWLDKTLALFQAHEQQVMHPSTSRGYLMGFKAGQRELLTELLGEAEEYEKWVGGNQATGRAITVKAVPVSVIERYREGLR